MLAESSLKGRNAYKGAEIASTLGAGLLGAGAGLLLPSLQSHGWAILVAGALVHGAGMTLKHRLEGRETRLAGWERALYWSCWVSLVIMGAWVAWQLAR
jgi:hypothetical protein